MSIGNEYRIELLETAHNKLTVFGTSHGHKDRMPSVIHFLEEIQYQGLHIHTSAGAARIVDFKIDKGSNYSIYHFWLPQSKEMKKVYGRGINGASNAELRGETPRWNGTILTIDLELQTDVDSPPCIDVNGVMVRMEHLKASL